MRFLIQRVARASVTVDGEIVGQIGHGLLILVGIASGDTATVGAKLIEKVINLRVFEDAAGKMNLSLLDINANVNNPPGVLAVSQFTLFADCRKGRRPSFTDAAPPEFARGLMNRIVAGFVATGIATQSGTFGAHMIVSIENDGPVTIMLDSDELFPADI